MALKARTTDDLIRIASAGGGLRIDISNRMTDDLVRIAYAAHSGKAKIYLIGLGNRVIDDLIRIASAGKGAVIFEDG